MKIKPIRVFHHRYLNKVYYVFVLYHLHIKYRTTWNIAIFSKEKFLLVLPSPYQCKEGFCIYGVSDDIYGTPEDVANACLKADQKCKAYYYNVDEGYGHLCKYSNSEDCSDLDVDGSGNCQFEGDQICIKNQGNS